MLENLTIKTRFTILIGIIIMSRLIIGFVDNNNFNTELKALNDVYLGGIEDNRMINEINDLYSLDVLHTTQRFRNEEISPTQSLNLLKENQTKINEIWNHYQKDAKQYSKVIDQNPHLINQIENQMKEVSTTIDRFQEAITQNDKELITKIISKEIPNLIPPLLKNLRELTHLHVEETENNYRNAITTILSVKNFSWISFIITTIIVIGFAIWTSTNIIKSLKQALTYIKKLTIGDLSFQIEHFSKNELGELLHAIQSLCNTNKKLVDVFTSVSQGNLDIKVEARSEHDTLSFALINMVENLRHIIGKIQDEVTNLTTSSEEIVVSVSQIATTSTETAAAVTETTTSVEELKQTAHLSEEKAKDVLANSQETLQIVKTNEKSLQATVEDMKQISDKMHSISEGIVKLSEHSQTIGKIIDTVNDLAEQSNLLAVNAAIEAAKAGEYGKGFVVVAQEFRTLAEQSKAATIQVRSILNEIQNSTTAAVLATEQGAKAVEKGVKQSTQTTECMETLSTSVTQVTQAANQIVISNQQQFVGVDQVTIAMNNISDAATQIVDHIKLIESTVISFNTIGANLKELTDQYVLKNDSTKPLTKGKK